MANITPVKAVFTSGVPTALAEMAASDTINKTLVGLGNVDNTSDLGKPVSTATTTALAGKEPTITAGTTSQYLRGDKSLATFMTELRRTQ